MNKIAVIFPGQGVQHMGMGKDFYDQFPVSREVYQLASRVSGLDVESLCFEENENIHITEYTQLALLTTEVAMLKVWEEKGIKIHATAGLSLGEYGALVAAKVLSMEDVFYVIRQRGIYMQEAVPTGGAMTAVLGMPMELIENVCNETEGVVSIANYNCPGQIVITGAKEAVDQAAEKLKELGAKRCIPLKVSGPFHSALLEGAGKKLNDTLESIQVKEIEIPYVSNVTANYVIDSAMVKELLTKQVSSSVRWQQSVEKMIADGITTFIEMGPGKTLSGFVKKINKEASVYNIQTVEDLNRVADELRNI